MSKVKIGNVFPPLAWLLQRCAPAGHGYGETMQYVYGSESELETIFSEIIATMENETTKQIAFACGDGTLYGRGRFKATIFRHESGYAYICAATYGNYAVMKTLSGGTWYPVEWVNPPMIVGVEYRTTERWQGKPVYTALVDCGTCVSPSKETTTELTCRQIIRHCGTVSGHSMPAINATMDNAWSAWAMVTNSNDRVRITVYSGTGMATERAYVQVWYTKD